MTAKNYENNFEIVIKPEEQQQFDQGVRAIKATMKSYGYAQEAVDSLTFKLEKYLLRIEEGERQSGAFHVYADNKPFFELHVKAPGSLMEMADPQNNPAGMAPKSQALFMVFELGMNLANRVPEGLNIKFGLDKSMAHGGCSFSPMTGEFDTTFRCSPAQFMDVLNELLGYRLQMLQPKLDIPASAAKPQKPSV